ncbi:MAG: hypothetical protein M8860_09420 [marine benthic group bacterium]|jgi:hypothetical protein|nr:hypothetical protein [Gemmatimonadota bacterium]MCL7963055.1 hypothetical protein [Candidatus Carthagonibacter metallireducens]MCL7957638.1 hypothetical protein [Gemmatimonadota bacterium]MCL7967193.1 hypothetical protein [Gemmatimonadota bacterium]MCL7969202.1 hypothetical protein [Gemmatimonadota bacterium]
MFRSIPLLAIAMTAGVAAILFSGLGAAESSSTGATFELDAEAWFI